MIRRMILILASLIPGANLAIATHDPALTIMGADRAGNAEGTIPAWTGGITTLPAGYNVGDWHPDPFSDDKILFTINKDNVAEFEDRLSDGHRAMIAKYPDTYRLNIYPTRRSASHPQSVLDHTIKYSGQAKIVDDGAGIEGIVIGTPFPHPQNGQEAIWNARLRYRAGGYSGYYTQALTTNNGAHEFSVWQHELEYMYSDHRTTLENFDNIHIRGLLRTLRPARDAGGMFVYLRFLNSKGFGERNWSYNPGQRRVKRDTNSPHGAPMYLSSGIHLWDQDEMWRGPITDFDWTLIGKKEIYVPYNAYQLHSGDTKVDSIIARGHINQELARYELHRVWVVEANLKADRAHIYQRRRFYIDEDSWNIMLADHYDENGSIDRFSESHNINYYEVPLLFPTLETYYKLDTARYYLSKIDNEYTPFDFSFDQNLSFYSPGRLKMKAKR